MRKFRLLTIVAAFAVNMGVFGQALAVDYHGYAGNNSAHNAFWGGPVCGWYEVTGKRWQAPSEGWNHQESVEIRGWWNQKKCQKDHLPGFEYTEYRFSAYRIRDGKSTLFGSKTATTAAIPLSDSPAYPHDVTETIYFPFNGVRSGDKIRIVGELYEPDRSRWVAPANLVFEATWQ